MAGMGKVCGGDHNLDISGEIRQMYPNTLMPFYWVAGVVSG